VTEPDRQAADGWRTNAVLAAAVVQIAAGVVGGAGLWGEPVGAVARSYPTPLLPGGGAFAIWSLIYVLFAALAIRQALPAQRARTVHRRTGWWLAAAGALSAGWVALFAHRYVLAAQVVIVALLAVLAVAAVRLVRTPARNLADRLLLHTPITLYTGWVAVAMVAGAATTGAALGRGPSTGGAVIAVLLTGVSAALAAWRLPAVAGFALAVCWALAWIAIGTPSAPVGSGAVASIVAVTVVVLLRLRHAADAARTAWG
jgi:hypothetical protein